MVITDLDDVTAEALGMQNTRGVFVRSVGEDGPAEEAGVEQGDVILAVDGKCCLTEVQKLYFKLRAKQEEE